MSLSTSPLSGDKGLVPLWGTVMCTGVPVLLPLNIWAAVSALKAYNRLSTHPWRIVECEVVPASSHGWRLRAYEEQPQGREPRVPAILRINGLVVSPLRSSVTSAPGLAICGAREIRSAEVSLRSPVGQGRSG